MRKLLVFFLVCIIGTSAIGQTKISLRSANRAECVKSDFTSLKASFSFSGLEATEVNTERGVFSALTMYNTVKGGSEGNPQIPVVNELIAVPFGASPRIEITSYSTTDYRLEDYGIHTLVPRQPDVFKSQDSPFVYNEAAYQTRGLLSEPMARVSVNGTMRGVQVGQLSIEPVSYDPVNNTLRVFNDIEVTVHFDGADARATEDKLVNTYSPYFDVLYKQLFNGRAVLDVYEEHPDLWRSPVKMLVIANRMFESCIQDWVAWKTTKGIYVDVNYTDNIGTSADAIKSFIQAKYAQNHPTFLIIMGDKDQVAPSVASASLTSCVSDLYYSSVDGDEFVDMFHSRMSAETTDQMTALINKCLEYEQYTMPDPSYLNNVLLIAGADSGYGVEVGRPTIWYATNYYYNAEHGFDNVYEFSHGTYTNCYAPLSSGVGFANYTAHGSKTSWADPSFSVSDVNNLTNEHKYFLAMGNCCQSGDWGYSTTCFGEALTRAENKGAYAYIGSCPNTTWYNDYYFGVGPTNRHDGTMPSFEETGTGCYDAIWMDDVYNTVNSILYVGTLAGNAAQALGYTMHSQTLYYWQAYHVIGDGSIMPYRVQPTANQVSHMAILPIGMSTYEVSAVPGSYVAITKDGVIHGTALVDESGTAQVQITPVTSSGDVTICVTAPNRIPYVQTVPAAALDGAYISVDGWTPTSAHVGDNTNLSITFKNVGTDASVGTTTVTLFGNDDVTIVNPTGSFGPLAANATTTVSGFSFRINPSVADGTNVTIHYTAENGGDTYEGNIVITANEAVLEYAGMTWDGGFTPGETLTLRAKFKNTGHWPATNAMISMSTSSNYVTINTQQISAGTIEVGQEVTYDFSVTIAANCPETAQLPVTFTMNANGGVSATGNEILKNACNVIFNLVDSYGDGWNGAKLTVSFDDGSASQDLTIASGSSENYTLEIGNGVHVTLTWSSGQYDGECSFSVSYEGDLVIFSQSSRPSAGVLYEFDCNCAAASQTFTVTATSSNTEYGTVSGGGEFNFGQSCTLTATPAEGYMFTNWTQNGTVISSSAIYTFVVNSDMNLVANFAQGTFIGDGSETTNTYLPSYSLYNHSLTQQIYTAEEIGGAGFITSISFYNGGSTKTRTYDFYLKTTSKNAFSGPTDWVLVTEADRVFSGSVVMTSGEWTIIAFDTPFLYDGSSNLVLVTDDNTGSWEGGMECRVFNAAGNQAIRIYSDGTNYDPFAPTSYEGTVMNVKNQLVLTKMAPPTELYVVTVSANPANAGTVSGGGEFNFGENCTVNAIPADGYSFAYWTQDGEVVSTEAFYTFAVSSNIDLVANFAGSIYVTVSVNPADAGTVSGVGEYAYGQVCTLTATPAEGYFFMNWTQGGVVISGNSTYSFVVENDVDLVANFAEGFMIGDGGDATSQYLPSYNFYNYTLSQQIYTSEELGADGIITSIAFYNGGTEKTRNYNFYMVATDKASFSGNTDWVAVSNSDKVFSGMVTMVAGDWTTIVLDNPFYYDGTSNIILVTDDNSGAYSSSPHMNCRVFNAPNQALYVYSDGTNYDPMMPPTEYSSNEYYAVLSQKNQLRFTKEIPTTEPINITVSADPEQGGTVSGGGVYDFNEVCTVTATVNVGFYFVGWAENGRVVSTDLEYSFSVVQDRNLVAVFNEGCLIGDGGNASSNYLPSHSYYKYSLTQQIYTAEEIGTAGTINSIAFFNVGEEKTRIYDMYMVLTDKSVFDSNSDWITVTEADKVFSGTVNMVAGEWTVFTLDTPFEYDGTRNLALIMDDNTGSFSQGMLCKVFETEGYQSLYYYSDNTNDDATAPTNNGNLLSKKNQIVLGITSTNVTQTISLSAGVNWFSTYVEITLDDLKAALETATPNTAVTIQSQTQNTSYNPNNHRWTGRLTALDLSKMYKITVAASCEITLTGSLINPANHPVTISTGSNWIAFPIDENMTPTEAFAGFAVNGDVLQSQTNNANYRNNRWVGQVNTLVPGKGYIYRSSESDNRTLVFPTNAK